jgi:choline-sulfatase
MEYAAEGTVTPMVCLREGTWKYIRCAADPEMLFDLSRDPEERMNLAADPAHAAVLEGFRAKADARWDLHAFDAAVRESQARRWVVYEALRNGAYFPWDHQPLRAASERYMRNHMDLNVLEESKRFPRGE